MSGTDTKSNNKYFCNRCKDQNYLIECKCGCGQVRFLVDNHRRIREYIHNHHSFGNNHWDWKGGIKYSRNYRYILMPDYPRADQEGYVAEHIYVYQEYNKCSLLPWGEIHHIDPVREGYCNNMVWNLMGVTKAQHRSLDRTKNMNGWTCSKCSSMETYIKPNGRPVWYYDKEDNRLCKKCYDKSRRVKKDRKKKDWTGTICYLCGSDKTIINHRGNYDWKRYQGDKIICHKCYKREYKKSKNK